MPAEAGVGYKKESLGKTDLHFPGVIKLPRTHVGDQSISYNFMVILRGFPSEWCIVWVGNIITPVSKMGCLRETFVSPKLGFNFVATLK